MRDFPSCFGENGVQILDPSSNGNKNGQNMVACVYQTNFNGHSFTITITWSRSLMGQGFSVSVDDCFNESLCKTDIKPWLFSKKKGTKSSEAGSIKVGIFWDLSVAKFASGPEPLVGFYVAILFDLEMVLLLGDLSKEAYRKTKATPPASNAMLVSRREHLFGKRTHSTRAQFCDNGQFHDIVIECETMRQKEDLSLEIRIDRKIVVEVKHLRWKFRGNQTILVGELPVEVCWDVHSWLFGAPVGNAVFMFQTCFSADKLLLLPCSQIFRDKELQGLGFSLILYAWKNE